ncbi:hypothetical protein TIFTF001_019544 [Ficus carica]|uniref:Uncharacterized protein n=1 Tax=Ficus carica TaxID=3494 RepID=A0AA88DJF4_FICCA|nr:hypothetical protein TIFTF001_019544 [Ficus carica]
MNGEDERLGVKGRLNNAELCLDSNLQRRQAADWERCGSRAARVRQERRVGAPSLRESISSACVPIQTESRMSPETLPTSVPVRSQGTVWRIANCNVREIEANDAEELRTWK